MSKMFWFFLLVSNYVCLISFKSLVLGLILLACSFSMSLLISIHVLSWYGLMFFIVYMGGLLVLFVYISSLKFKPMLISKDKKYLWVLKVNFFVCMFLSFFFVGWKYGSFGSLSFFDFKKFSLNLFKEYEMVFLVNMGILLLMVLWMMTKLTFRSRGALRPMFLSGSMKLFNM